MDGVTRFEPAKLARMAADAPFDQQLASLRSDGVLILHGALSGEQLDELDRDLDFWFERAPGGEGAFFGRRTRRFAGLLAKAKSALHLVLHDRILALCEQVLIASDIGPPRCDQVQLSIAQ